MSSPVASKFMTVAETAAFLGMSKRTIRRMLDDGRLVAYRVGRTVRVDGSSVTALLWKPGVASTPEPQMRNNDQPGVRLGRRLRYKKEWTGFIAGMEVALGTPDEELAKTRLHAADGAWKKLQGREEELEGLKQKCFAVREKKHGYILKFRNPDGVRCSKRVSLELVGQFDGGDRIKLYALLWYLANVEIAEPNKTNAQTGAQATVRASSATSVAEVARMWFSGELTQKYGPEYVKPKKSARDDEVRFNRYIGPVVGDVAMSDVRGDRTSLFADAIVERIAMLLPSASPATRRQVLQVFNRLINIAVFPLRLLPTNDLPRGYLPTPKSNKAFSNLYPDEEAKLLACIKVPVHHRLFFGVLDREGLRVSELRNLEWSDVDLDRGLLRLDENKTDDPRTWKMDDGVVEALRRWQLLQSPEVRAKGFIVAHPRTGRRFPHGKAAGRLRKALKKAGVERAILFESTDARMAIRGHDLRSTFVTISLAQGKTEAWVTDRTGHRSSTVLYRYKRAARTHAEAELGSLVPLHEAIPELAEQAL